MSSLVSQKGQFKQIFDYCFHFHCFVSSLGISEIMRLAFFVIFSSYYPAHIILVKSPCTFPLHSRRENNIRALPQWAHCFLPTLQFTAFHVDREAAVAFLITLQRFLNLPNSFLVSSSYIFMEAGSPVTNVYPFIIYAMSSCVLLCKCSLEHLYFCNKVFQTLLSI